MSLKWLKTFTFLTKLTTSLALATVIFCLYLLFTPHGSALLLSVLSEMTPYQITYSGFSGYLARQVTFEDLHIKGKGVEIHAETLHMRWNMVDLLRKTKSIETLSASKFVLHYQGKKLDATHTGRLFPFPFIIENVNLHRAQFNIGEDKHDVDILQLKRASSDDLTSIEEIYYQGTFGHLQATMRQSIDATWDLHFEDAPFLAPYLPGNVHTQGKVFLPKRKWRDPNNVVDIMLTGDRVALEGTHLSNFVLNIKGTLAKHEGQLQGKLKGTPFRTHFKGKLSATAWKGSIKDVVVDNEYSNELSNTQGTIEVDWSEKVIASKLHLLLGNQQPISAELSIKKNKARSIKGNVKASIAKLKSLAAFFPELRRINGSSEIDVNLSGTLNKIKFHGTVLVNDIRIKVPRLKSTAVIPQLTLTLSKNQDIQIKGQGTFGSGSFSLDGTGSLKNESPVLALRLKGEQLLLSDTPEYYIVANPDLTFTLKNTGPKIEGRIFIPHAEIQSLKSPDTITPSQDVVIVSKKKEAVKAPPSYSLANQLKTHIDIVLGDKITYQGYGVTTEAKGQLTINQLPGQPTKAIGKITLHKGKYRAYGKKFDIEEGELLFTGGVIENPTLNIRAERKIQTSPSAKSFHAQNTITAGVKFMGPLNNTHIEFYSNPPMSNADIISYLVVGQPQGQMNHAQAELLFQALSQLTLFSGSKRNDVKMDLAEQLKLDQFGFTKKENSLSDGSGSNPLQDTAFVLGKQLSDRLYLHYSLGLIDSSNNVGLKYFVNKNVTIEASTGTEGTSADILLTFEGH